ncbi:MAG: ABC transporter substrate-binding protein, partial [Thermodesulfobacteriota bacterium]
MNKIKIGLSISLTGNYSIQGVESFEGIKLWVEQTNSRGGIIVSELGAKLPIELVYYDDKSSIDICRANTQRLILEDKVNLLLGPYSSSLAITACEVAEEHNKTLWNHGGSTDEIEERNFTSVINAITPASNYSHGIIDAIKKTDPSAEKIAAFSARDSGFSTRVANGAKEHAQALGLDVREYKFISGTKDFSEHLEDLVSYDPDLILGMGRAHDDLALTEFLFKSEVYSKAAGFIVASIKLFKDRFGEQAEGILSASQWERGLKITPDIGPTPEEFAANFKSAYGKYPDYVAAQGYN